MEHLQERMEDLQVYFQDGRHGKTRFGYTTWRGFTKGLPEVRQGQKFGNAYNQDPTIIYTPGKGKRRKVDPKCQATSVELHKAASNKVSMHKINHYMVYH